MTDAERHQRAKSLFLDLVALPQRERAAVLARECAGDPAMREEVESLLAHASDIEDDTRSVPNVTIGKPRRFTTGDVFADRYRIVAAIGRGAAGEVYRALDTRLGVEIALKILHRSSPTTIRHLIDEVRLARQLTHPAICRIYDIEEAHGDYFLTMELVDGEDLASLLARVGRLSEEKVRTIGIELCQALAAAHGRGVLHRDLKPSNVMVDGAGAIRLTDFGVAALERAAETAPLAGTPAYMAPEQLTEGAPASVKTDLYAVGLILYEALVGRAAKSETADGAIVPALAPPPRPSLLVSDVSPDLEAVVMSLLETVAEKRPDSAMEVAERLAAPSARDDVRAAPPHDARSSRRPRVALAVIAGAVAVAVAYYAAPFLTQGVDSKRTIAEQVVDASGVPNRAVEGGIAVLPIVDESEKHDQGYLAEAIQDRVIERLTSIRGLRVIGEESIDRFGPETAPTIVARELGIDFVAVGTLRGIGETSRVELTLLDGKNGRQIWTESHVYGGVPSKALEVDRDIAEELVSRLRLHESTPATRAGSVSHPDTQTYSLYLRGRENVPPFSRREFDSSIDLLKDVITRAPAFAPAYATLATAYVKACAQRWLEPREGYPMARRYADRAVALDPSLAEPHVALALIAGEYDWDWQAAEASYKRALELSPGSAWVYRSFARFLSTQGRFEESLAATRKALELEPNSSAVLQGAAQRFFEARQYDRSVAMARLAIRLDPINPYSYPSLASALLMQGRYDEAIVQLEKVVAIAGVDATGQARIAYAYAQAGTDEAAAAAAAETRRIGIPDALERALLAMAEHDDTAAITALTDAVEARAPPSIWLAVVPQLDPLRERDDFRALVARVGLPEVKFAASSSPR
jgi:serine/threonine protein kinase/tetratricopeptide (TPR) repeat protein